MEGRRGGFCFLLREVHEEAGTIIHTAARGLCNLPVFIAIYTYVQRTHHHTIDIIHGMGVLMCLNELLMMSASCSCSP